MHPETLRADLVTIVERTRKNQPTTRQTRDEQTILPLERIVHTFVRAQVINTKHVNYIGARAQRKENAKEERKNAIRKRRIYPNEYIYMPAARHIECSLGVSGAHSHAINYTQT